MVAFAVLLAVGLVLGAVACGEDEPAPPAATLAPGGSASPGGGDDGGGDDGGGATADGEQVYAENCAGCHNEDGSGGFGPGLQDVTDQALVETTVTNGKGQMPAFQGQLTPEQIQAVAQYVVDEL
jgi:mono/diheme cytochrome c family protein